VLKKALVRFDEVIVETERESMKIEEEGIWKFVGIEQSFAFLLACLFFCQSDHP